METQAGGCGYNRGLRGVAQPGSATALGAVGRTFESSHPDQKHEGRQALACRPFSFAASSATAQQSGVGPRTEGRLAPCKGLSPGKRNSQAMPVRSSASPEKHHRARRRLSSWAFGTARQSPLTAPLHRDLLRRHCRPPGAGAATARRQRLWRIETVGAIDVGGRRQVPRRTGITLDECGEELHRRAIRIKDRPGSTTVDAAVHASSSTGFRET